jgi:hypothetical protein
MSNAVIGPKPLMMSTQSAAGIIQRGLARGRRQIAFPFLLYLGMQLLRVLPAALADRLLRNAEVDIAPYE